MDALTYSSTLAKCVQVPFSWLWLSNVAVEIHVFGKEQMVSQADYPTKVEKKTIVMF